MLQGIIEVLASDITVVGQSDFTANSAVDDVLVNTPAANGLAMFNGNGASKFALGDSPLIRKIWCVIPWGFGAGGIAVTTFLHLVDFDFWDGAALFDLPPLPNSVVLPTLCDPLDFGEGIFCPMATTGALRQIRVTNIKLRVSQINIPAALNGDRIPVQYYMEVNHTYPLSV